MHSQDYIMLSQWAYDENFLLSEQDEDLILHHEIFLPLLYKFVEDKHCPKSAYILWIIDCYIKETILYQKIYSKKILHILYQTISFAKKSQRKKVQEWALVLRRMAWYVEGVGSVDRELAIQIGLDLLSKMSIELLGEIDDEQGLFINILMEDHDSFTVGILTPEKIYPYDKHLIISKSTGAFRYHPYYSCGN